MLGPRLVGPMPRDTLFLLRTYDAGDGGTVALLTALVTNPLKILKTDRFLRLIAADVSATAIPRPAHLRV